MNTHPLKILLIEDEIAYADWIDAILADDNLPPVEIKHVKRLREVSVCLSENNFDAILLDLSLPDSKGMDSIVQVKKRTSNLPIIVLTYLNDQDLALQALRYGIQDYLIKGNFTGELLIRSIHYAIERQRSEVASRQQALMKKMLDRIRQSLDLKEILDSTVAEVRQFLNVDKVLIYRYQTNQIGEIVTESREAHQEENTKNQAAGSEINFWKIHSFLSKSDSTQAIEDVRKEHQKKIHILADSKIRSILTLTITRSSIIRESINTSNALSERIESNFLLLNILATEHSQETTESNHLLAYGDRFNHEEFSDLPWGMLVAYNRDTPRKWRDWEIEFLKQLTTQVTIAIQQSELYSKLQDINRKLEQLAILDGLTGVANRRYFDRVLHNEWQRLAREQKPLSLILCDIDYFKLYNDTYGHPAGDRSLQAVARVLKTAIKRPADLVARYGGEEFAVILPDTNTQGAYFLANKMRDNLADLQLEHKKSTVSPYVTLSIGIATQIPNYHLSCHKLIEQADRRLYQAKQQGRDCITTEGFSQLI